MLNLAPRALWQVAGQLLGKGTVVWPAGIDESGYTTGPCFMCDDAVGGLNSHVGHLMGWPLGGHLYYRSWTAATQNGARCGSMGRGLADYIARYRTVRLTVPITAVPLRRCVLWPMAAADCQHTFRCAA